MFERAVMKMVKVYHRIIGAVKAGCMSWYLSVLEIIILCARSPCVV